VGEGDAVEAGAVIGKVAAPDMGVNIHSSIGGKVTRVTETFVEIRA
jgi:biotin carboxyl carrier protein